MKEDASTRDLFFVKDTDKFNMKHETTITLELTEKEVIDCIKNSLNIRETDYDKIEFIIEEEGHKQRVDLDRVIITKLNKKEEEIKHH
jgi:hypothetical protein